MRYRSLDEMRTTGPVYRSTDLTMSRRERLLRWADLLDRHPGTVRVLRETEYRPRHVRDTLRADASPLTVAFQDPLLRMQGLTGDTYGDAVRFFELSDVEAHHILCHCHYCRSDVPARQVANRVRAAAGTSARQIFGWAVGMGAGVTALGALVLAL